MKWARRGVTRPFSEQLEVELEVGSWESTVSILPHVNSHLIRRPVLSAVLLLTLSVSGWAQGSPNATPESLGMSTERLQRLSAAMKQAVDDGQVAGLVTLVMRKGKVAHFQSFGELDREQHVPMPKDAIFRIASMSKAITSVAAVMLMEEGKIVIDDPVSRFIPAYKKTTVMVPATTVTGDMTTVPARREITIRDLLTQVTCWVPWSRKRLG
jgi:CubicO group peptidase (beta-lactamase class C family)